MKASALRAKSDEALHTELIEQRKTQFNLRMQQGTGQLTRSADLGSARRNVARIKTILNERRKAAGTQ